MSNVVQSGAAASKANRPLTEDEDWIDSMTLEAWQRAGRAFLALDELRTEIQHGQGPREEVLFRRIARELSEIRDLLGTCRRNHIRPVVERAKLRGRAPAAE